MVLAAGRIVGVGRERDINRHDRQPELAAGDCFGAPTTDIRTAVSRNAPVFETAVFLENGCVPPDDLSALGSQHRYSPYAKATFRKERR